MQLITKRPIGPNGTPVKPKHLEIMSDMLKGYTRSKDASLVAGAGSAPALTSFANEVEQGTMKLDAAATRLSNCSFCRSRLT